MSYELIDPTNRSEWVHEYWNTETEERVIVKKHGRYDIQETFLTPKGEILFLAYNGYASQPYAVGIYNSDHGVYWTDPDDARRHYAWQVAASFGLVVDKEGSKAVVPASREYATSLVQKIVKDSEFLQQATKTGDEVGIEAASGALEGHALSLSKHLQRIGVLSTKVFTDSEVVG
ncbi:hypothetical protein ABZX93_06005 [Streptomyces sp. NPDC006632]|uniref:hypothetical protein n=1 Tax=Streptomyces sp. NPDC006632 TaxID=3157182 RepID=UPI0033B7A760